MCQTAFLLSIGYIVLMPDCLKNIILIFVGTESYLVCWCMWKLADEERKYKENSFCVNLNTKCPVPHPEKYFWKNC